jgi:hypothetical protein
VNTGEHFANNRFCGLTAGTVPWLNRRQSRVPCRGAHPDIALDRCDHQRHGAEYDEHEVTGQPQPLDQARSLALTDLNVDAAKQVIETIRA